MSALQADFFAPNGQLNINPLGAGNIVRINTLGLGIMVDPAQALHAAGNIYATGNIISGAQLGLGEISAPPKPPSGNGILYVKSSDSLLYYKSDAGTEYSLTTGGGGSSTFSLSGSVAYYTDGFVGIGTTSPSQTLSVMGNVAVSGNISGNAQFYAANGTAAAPSYSFTNDTDAGFYLGAAGNISAAIGGAQELTLTDTYLYLKGVDLFTDRWTNKSSHTLLGAGVVGGGALSLAAYGNTGYGVNALYNTTTGFDNVAIGSNVLYNNTSGYQNVGVGVNNLYSSTTGYANASVGWASMTQNTSGNSNSALGVYSLRSNTVGHDNAGVGGWSMFSNTSGHSNSALGNYVMYNNSTGYGNTALGTYSMFNNTTGYYNVSLGYQAMQTSVGGNVNVAIGYNSLFSNTIGYQNTALGPFALFSSTYARNNVGVGFNAGYNIISGGNNLMLGTSAGDLTTTGERNIIIGYNQDAPAATTSDFLNIGGAIFGDLATQRIAIGTPTAAGNFHVSGNIYSNYYMTGEITAPGTPPAGNLIMYAKTDGKLYTKNDSGTELELGSGSGGGFTEASGNATYTGNVGIGTTAPTQKLHVAGNVIATGNLVLGSGTTDTYTLLVTGNVQMGGNIIPSANVTYDLGSASRNWRDIYSEELNLTSDERKKDHIVELGYGLESVMKLKPVKYTWKNREAEGERIGLLAQDVQKVMAELVNEGNDADKSLSIRYNALIPVLIKAIQEQQREIDALRREIKKSPAERPD